MGLKDCYILYNRQGEKPNGLYIKEKAVVHATSMVFQKRSSRAISELSSEVVNYEDVRAIVKEEAIKQQSKGASSTYE